MDKKEQNPAVGKEDRKKVPKTLAVIDQRGCTGCHACVPLCPVDCIENVPGPEHPDFMRLVEVDLERCIGCTICAQYCPWETIFMVPVVEGDEKAKEWTVRSILYKGLGETTDSPPVDQP
jgi:formate hydrogenlyase subunit 6/NADH:ubiquinone oxidoreductase subunit I